jgi:hypothetical protein
MLDAKSDRMIIAATDQAYKTWYEFKKDLETLCGHPVLNTLWLQVKPSEALPWGKKQIQSVLSKIS